MIQIDWNKDYGGEFSCPYCDKIGLKIWGTHSNKKRRFKCFNCQKILNESYDIHLESFIDSDTGTIWYKSRKVDGFVCPNPNCQESNVYFWYHSHGKKQFKCRRCKTITCDSIELTSSNLNRFSHKTVSIKPFLFESDKWDLRSIVTSTNGADNKFTVNFEEIYPLWFKLFTKWYIHSLCKQDKPTTTIQTHLSNLRFFARYLNTTKVNCIEEVNRGVILNFLTESRKLTGDEGIRHRLGVLRNFFIVGNFQGWFNNNDQDMIRSDDFPKSRKGNPEPLSDLVREEIEQHLYRLPVPIARMWIIGFFTAMRPNELVWLRKDCLIQEGSHWKIIWSRRKGKDQHEVPVTRIIAKVVQEQLEYIEQLWGNEWDYLFCHYQGISDSNLEHPKLQPVKKKASVDNSPLKKAIRTLIKVLNIRDENGSLAEFSPNLIRSTRLTQLFEQGHDLAVVSAWAGHKTLETTSTFYTYVSCQQIEDETGHIQKALFNADGKPLHYESLPKSFWENPTAHQLELSGDHINTPIYGYCGLPLDERCEKFRACYTCRCFVAVPEKLPQYIKVRDELRAKESRAKANGQDVLVEQFGRQSDQLDKIIASLQEAA